MTEMESTGTSESFDNSMASSAAPAQESRAPDERLFRQNEVSDIVKRAKREAVESFQRKMHEQPDYVQQKYGDAPFNRREQPSLGIDEIRKLAAEEASRHMESVKRDAEQQYNQQMAKQIIEKFTAKLNLAKQKYQDFDTVTEGMQLGNFPNLIQLVADHLDNAEDVLYELGKDRTKMVMLEGLCASSPSDALIQARRLANSIKVNEDASRQRMPNEPLSQLKPSNQGTGSGPMTVKDFKARFKV